MPIPKRECCDGAGRRVQQCANSAPELFTCGSVGCRKGVAWEEHFCLECESKFEYYDCVEASFADLEGFQDAYETRVLGEDMSFVEFISSLESETVSQRETIRALEKGSAVPFQGCG